MKRQNPTSLVCVATWTILTATALAGCASEDRGSAQSCPAGELACGNGCVDPARDPRHCGGCGQTCPQGQSCAGGVCQRCPEGQSWCGAACAELASSPQHCGECGHACAAGELCLAGRCEAGCGDATVLCGEACVDPQQDRLHCGGCGRECAPDELCEQATCARHCPSGLALCADACRDTSRDRNHCGSCERACGEQQICQDRACVLSCGGFTPLACGEHCVNPKLDPAHCGGCDRACSEGELCHQGECIGPGACKAPFTACDGRCTSTALDPDHCGGCGQACPAPENGLGACHQGTCTQTCVDGYGDCDGDLVLHDASFAGNGCETDLTTSALHCGACWNRCAAPAHGTAACVAGACGLGACSPGYGNCDSDSTNGCETDLANDRAHCGDCGTACAAGRTCIEGACVATGEDCTSPIALAAGANSVRWHAASQSFLAFAPACGGGAFPQGPDVVMSFTARVAGVVQFSVEKPANERWHLVVSRTCGDVSASAPGYACVSEATGTSLSTLELTTTAGAVWFVHLVATTASSNGLSNPLTVNVLGTEQADCSTGTTSVVSRSPEAGAAAASLTPSVVVTFDRKVDRTAGRFTFTGSLGTAVTLSVGGLGVMFSNADKTVTLVPSANFLPGESITVNWSGLVDSICQAPIAAPAGWVFTAPVPPCVPGQSGMVGTAQERMASGLTSMDEYYVAADSDPRGYVYVGSYGMGTAASYQVYRMPKAGGALENVYALAGLGPAQLGYVMLVDGSNIYTVESATTLSSQLVFRISSDGGAHWELQNMARFPTLPADDFVGAAAYGGRIYLITNENTATEATQIWSFNPGAATLPDTATLDRSFGANEYAYCSGLSLDAQGYYTMCRKTANTSVWAVLRIDRASGAITVLTESFSGANVSYANSVLAVDRTGDGVADYVYVQTGRHEVYHVCPNAGVSWADRHTTFRVGGSSSANWGMAYDASSNSLWVFDDSTREFVRIH